MQLVYVCWLAFESGFIYLFLIETKNVSSLPFNILYVKWKLKLDLLATADVGRDSSVCPCSPSFKFFCWLMITRLFDGEEKVDILAHDAAVHAGLESPDSPSSEKEKESVGSVAMVESTWTGPEKPQPQSWRMKVRKKLRMDGFSVTHRLFRNFNDRYHG